MLIEKRRLILEALRKQATPSEDTSKSPANEGANFTFSDMILQKDLVKGRLVRTTNAVEPKTLLFRGRPFSVIINFEFRHRRCHHCFVDVTDWFWPCQVCNEVVYCSRSCADQDMARAHRHECGMTAFWALTDASMGHVFHTLCRVEVKKPCPISIDLTVCRLGDLLCNDGLYLPENR